MSEFIVMEACARRPSGKWYLVNASYRRVAILEVEDGYRPKRISVRNKRIIRVIKTWENLNTTSKGSGKNTAYARARREADELVASEFALRMRVAAGEFNDQTNG